MSRNLHLGLDWGTSATKLVLRDYDAIGASHGLGYIIRTADKNVRHPSLVVLEGGRLWFGESAKIRITTAQSTWVNLKADIALWGRSEAEAAGGLKLRDLAVLFLAHILSKTQRAAQNLPGGTDPDIGFKLGVPTAEMNSWKFSSEYLRIARAALHLSCNESIDPDGVAVGTALKWMAAAWAAVRAREVRSRTTGEVIEAWLRAEAASEMIWPFNSPSIQPGLYTAVDVGAGTTNACFFNIHTKHSGARHDPKGALSFFGAACSAPGLNDLLAAVLGNNLTPLSLENMRGTENVLLAKSAQHALTAAVIDRYRDVWSKAKQQAWGCYPGYSNWDGLRLLVVGGGGKVDRVRQAFEQRNPFGRLIERFNTVPDLGVPGDLRELPAKPGVAAAKFKDDPTFLLTAYGLSFETDDLPEITLPAGIPPFRPAGRVRQFVGHDDRGYEKR